MNIGEGSDPDALLNDAVDLYCHANPDLFNRAHDDIALAREYLAAGFLTALHRHHFSSTVERAQLAEQVTGFRMLGAIVLNESVGGINPRAVEVALRYGAAMVVFPTLSAAHYRKTRWPLRPSANTAIDFGRQAISYLDDAGRLSDDAHQVLELVCQHDAALNVGYGSPAERLILAREAHKLGIRACVMTNPMLYERQPDFRDQSLTAIDELVAMPNTFVELTAYSLSPSYVAGVDPNLGPNLAALMRRIGTDRAVLSSDGGMADSPAPRLLLEFALGTMTEQGMGQRDLKRLVSTNPSVVLGL